MKKIAVLFNSPYLGGAERSIIIQTSKIKNYKVTYIIPYLINQNESENLEKNIKDYGDFEIKKFQYPNNLFFISRSSLKFNPIKILNEVHQTYKYLNKLLSGYELFWCNGNKIGLLIYFYNLFFLKKHIIWHFRDYSSGKMPFSLLWKYLSIFNNKKSLFLANSKSVQEEIDKQFQFKVVTDYLYNPVGLLPNKNVTNKSNLETIGIVSMIAPWKGIHQIISFVKLYKDQLKNLGIKNINIYGKDIYQTKGEHSNYFNYLKQINNSCVTFKGLMDPIDIYNEIDLLIHPSIAPEPFGRVLIEAASLNIPVISTGLGGAGEIGKIINAKFYKNNDFNKLLQIIMHFCNLESKETATSNFNSIEWDQKIYHKVDRLLDKLLKS